MPSNPSTGLVAAYLATISDEISVGSELSVRSRWALAHAHRQLSEDRDVLSGDRPANYGAKRAGLTTDFEPPEPRLADIVVRSARQAETDSASAMINAAIRDIEAAELGDPQAATRLVEIFG